MGACDASGLAITLDDPEARADWDRTVRAVLAHGAEAPVLLSRVLERAPGFGLGWAARGLFLLLLGRAELRPLAAEAAEAARAGFDAQGGTPRERAYLAALRAWLNGRPSGAVAHLAAVLECHPGDALAMKLDHGIRFMIGDRQGMERQMRAVIPAYRDDHPHGGFAQGCLAFALEENGAYPEAERAGRAGLERAGDDAWGLHAVAHVYDMTARNADGIAWLTRQQEAWAHCNNFGYHVWWHLGLFHLDRGEHDRVLDLYDRRIRADRTDDYRDIANAASMLTRLEIEGVDVGDRWEELGALSAGRVEDGSLVFADLHYLLALDGSGRRAEADRLVQRLADDAARGEHEMHEVAAVAGHPAAMGLAAFRAGQYGLAFERLRRVRSDLQRVGGSHAQRDVFSRIMIEAALRAGLWDAAEAEIRARARRRGAEDGFTHRRLAALDRARRAAAAAG